MPTGPVNVLHIALAQVLHHQARAFHSIGCGQQVNMIGQGCDTHTALPARPDPADILDNLPKRKNRPAGYSLAG